MIKKISQILSFVFSPLLVPTYGILLAFHYSYLMLAPTGTKAGVTAVVFIFTCLFPLLLIGTLWKLGKVSDPGLNSRTDRTVPYLITAASYVAAVVYLFSVKSPMWLIMFFCGGLMAVAFSTVINRWWKISAHMAAMGGLLALCMCMMTGGVAVRPMIWIVLTVAVLCGLVGSARLELERHTLGQVGAGFVNGMLCVGLLTLLIK